MNTARKILLFICFFTFLVGTKAYCHSHFSRTKIIKMKVTAYCPCKKCCGRYAKGRTSTGKNAWKTQGVAACPKIISYGTYLAIPKVGIRKVDDTGQKMRNEAKKGIHHIDIRMRNHQTAKNFGVKWLKVKIIKKT